MKSLSNHILEDVVPIQSFITEDNNPIHIPKDSEGFWTWAKESGKIDKIQKLISEEDVELLFELAEVQPENRQMPFVVNYGGNKVFACRRWVGTVSSGKLSSFDPNKTVKGVYAGLHDTTFNDDMTRISRSDRGLAQEAKDIADILYFCKLAYEYAGKDKADKTELYKLVSEKDLSRFIEMYEKGAFDTIIKAFPEQIKKYGEEGVLKINHWTDYIRRTGATNTHRNDKGELYDENFVLNTGDVDNVLKNSGRIIADITIYKKPGKIPPKKTETDPNAKVESDDIYISCKMKTSQLSGVSARKAMESNEAFIKGMTPVGGKYPTFESLEKQLGTFVQFWDNFGVDAKEIYNHFQAVEQNTTKEFVPQNIKEYNAEALGTFIRKLVGGNYWYLKPDSCKFVPTTPSNLSFKVLSVNISPEARTIDIGGKINDKLKCVLTLRTDNKDVRSPYRIFPKVNVPDLIEMCSVDDSNAKPE